MHGIRWILIQEAGVGSNLKWVPHSHKAKGVQSRQFKGLLLPQAHTSFRPQTSAKARGPGCLELSLHQSKVQGGVLWVRIWGQQFRRAAVYLCIWSGLGFALTRLPSQCTWCLSTLLSWPSAWELAQSSACPARQKHVSRQHAVTWEHRGKLRTDNPAECSQICAAPRGALPGRASAPAPFPVQSLTYTLTCVLATQAASPDPWNHSLCIRKEARSVVRVEGLGEGTRGCPGKQCSQLCSPGGHGGTRSALALPEATGSSSNHSALRGSQGPCGALNVSFLLPAESRWAIVTHPSLPHTQAR